MLLNQKINALYEYMRNIGYSECYLNSLDKIWQKFAKSFSEHPEEALTFKAQNQFLIKNYGASLTGNPRPVKIQQYQAFRAINLLNEFIANGNISIRYKAKDFDLPTEFENSLKHFEEFCSNYLKHRKSTIFSNTRWVTRFLKHCIKNGVTNFSLLSEDIVIKYLELFPDISNKTKWLYVNAIKCFDKYLFFTGITKKYFTLNLNVNNKFKPNYIPAWSSEDIKKLLGVLDKTNAIELRDYAMILIAATLGLRISDILNLKFKDIDFKIKTITINQIKTDQPNKLPLPSSVGWAIIDYVKKARPKVKSDHIFLRHSVPYGPFPIGSRSDFSNRMDSYLQRAKIVRKRGKGFHSFRHALATCLINEGIPVGTISDILGHSSCQSTDKYLSLDESSLSLCPLDIDSIIKNKNSDENGEK